ncbi:MAG: hypothetical protein V2A76_17045 [Planctomycetota bacterium]
MFFSTSGFVQPRLLHAMLLLVCFSGCGDRRDATFLEFRITQDLDLIQSSEFKHPAQIAIWLEAPASGRTRTLFVTHCSATGEWKGEAERPTALPRWFAVFKEEFGHLSLPRPGGGAPDAVTQATPRGARYCWRTEIEANSAWICWVEVNISGDFNDQFPRRNEETGEIDTDSCGQPSLLYRCELTATRGAVYTPELFERTIPGTDGEVTTDLASITSARDILESIEIRVAD